jgi:hypothetical protein
MAIVVVVGAIVRARDVASAACTRVEDHRESLLRGLLEPHQSGGLWQGTNRSFRLLRRPPSCGWSIPSDACTENDFAGHNDFDLSGFEDGTEDGSEQETVEFEDGT